MSVLSHFAAMSQAAANRIDYYVDPAGSDSNNGKTPATAWATLTKIGNLGSAFAGKVIAFKRGGVWRGRLDVPQNNMTLRDYGSGALPVLKSSTNLTAWTLSTQANVYYATLSGTVPCNIAVDNSNGQAYRIPKTALASITGVGQYWHDTTNNRLYIYKTAAPSDVDASNQHYPLGISGIDGTTVLNLDLEMGSLYGGFGGNGLFCSGTHGTRVQGCTFANNWNHGLSGQDNGTVGNHDLKIINCIAHGNGGTGIFASNGNSDRVLVYGCECYDNCWDSTSASSSSDQNYNAGIKAFQTTTRWLTITQCYCHDNGNTTQADASQFKGCGIWIDTVGPNTNYAAGGANVTNNKCCNNTHAGIMVEMVGYHLVAGNICYQNGGRTRGTAANLADMEMCGILLYRGTSGCLVYNNTCYDNGAQSGQPYAAQIVLWSDAGANGAASIDSASGLDQRCFNNLVRNNIMLTSAAGQAALLTISTNNGDPTSGVAAGMTGNVFEYNCMGAAVSGFIKYGPRGTSYSSYATFEAAYASQNSVSSNTHSVQADPGCTAASGFDFSLTAGSPCRGTGLAGLGVSVGYDLMPFASPPNLGAYAG